MSGLPFVLSTAVRSRNCDDRIVVRVYTATGKLIFKFQLHLNSSIWLVATVLNRSGPQKAKKKAFLKIYSKGIYFT